MDADEILQFRKMFASIGVHDPLKLRAWFSEYSDMTLQEQCLIINRSMTTVLKMRQFAQVNPVMLVEMGNKCLVIRKRPLPIAKLERPVISIPQGWEQNIEWLNHVYSELNLSIRQLSRLTGRCRLTVTKVLRRAKIKVKSANQAISSKNQCCTEQWVKQHYVDLNLDEDKCAKLAGVCEATFRAWLSKFNIAARDAFDRTIICRRIGRGS